MTIATVASPPAPPIAPPEPPRQFFTLQSIGSLAGASTGLYIVVGTISKATDWKFPAWFPLLMAVALVVCIDLAGTNLWQGARAREIPARVLVLALNSCLVYSSAVGGAVALTNDQPETEPVAAAPTPPQAAPLPPVASPRPAEPSSDTSSDKSAGAPPVLHRVSKAERRAGFSRLVDALRE